MTGLGVVGRSVESFTQRHHVHVASTRVDGDGAVAAGCTSTQELARTPFNFSFLFLLQLVAAL